jgi:error-prone DNA polymerase
VSYVPLWCKSSYSFLEGASHPDELVEEALRLGLPGLALTDRDGLYGAVRAHLAARGQNSFRLILGAQVTVEDDSTIMLLAANRDGYANLCRLLSAGRLRCEKGRSSVTWREICDHADGIVALWGGEGSLLAGDPDPLFVARFLREAFQDRLYALMARHRRPEEARIENRIRGRARRYGVETVAAVEVLYHTPGRRVLQDILTCIRHGVSLDTAGCLLRPNDQYALPGPDAFAALFADDPRSVARTLEVAEQCSFSLSEIHYRYPAEKLPDGKTSSEWLRQLTFEGALERYPNGIPEAVCLQLERELGLIRELDYDGYFLTMWEIVRFCREREILCQGRGSAANSAVCFCLRITAVDPVRMGLLFERFLSRERAEPPDIDLDIEHERREEVIQHVYARYGRTHAAMVANFIRYRIRSAVRDVGKALGFAETEVDRLAKLLPIYGDISPQILLEAGFDPANPTHAHLLRLTEEIQDFPRHLSIHPGGFLLGHEPVCDIVPIENATMEGRTVIQWDKEDIENLDLFKIDLLGLGALRQLHLAFDLIRAHWDHDLSMAAIPPEDPATFAMIQKADTVGVFQIESRAQMAMLPRLKPRTYYDLVIQVAIIRPGPITGGMVHPFLRRRNGQEKVIYPHPSLRPVLEKTLGVPLFQEQVMKLAVVAADYTPGEADQLRRDMAAWRVKGRIERHHDRFVPRMVEKGIPQEFAERVFEQIRGFGEYGFPESHAASFALIAYATAWVRRHYPEAFYCSLLNAQPMGFYAPATIVADARRRAVTVLPVNVQAANWDCRLEPGAGRAGARLIRYAVRMGLRYVKGLGEQDGERIETARREGPFRSVADFVARTGLESNKVARLAEAGAMASIKRARRQALWEARGVSRPTEPALNLEAREPEMPFAPLTLLEEVSWDYSASGHSTLAHPLAPLRFDLTAQGLPSAREVQAMHDGRRIRYAGLVICRQQPATAHGAVFMTLEDETGFVNLILWRDVFLKHRVVARTSSFLGLTGKVQSESGVVNLVAEELWVPVLQAKPVRTESRNFH